MPSLDERYHYHHGLKAGANLVRVLMRSIIKNEGYEQSEFLSDFIEYMTDVDANNDPYLEIYIRDWFENYSKGVAPELCAPSQRDRWSIGSHGGIVRPLVLALTAKSSYEGLGIAVSHQQLTHSSQNVSSALGTLVPLLTNILNGNDPLKLLN
jgi:ADP-ribosyl-[dinitrogen reductase] hydrolase